MHHRTHPTQQHPQCTATKATCRVFSSRATMGWSLACQLVSEPTKQSFQRVFIRNNRLGDTHTRYNQATNQRVQSADNHARIITRWHNHQQAVAFTRYQSVPSVSLARVTGSLWRGRLPLMQHRAPPPNTYIITYYIPHHSRTAKGVIPTTYRPHRIPQKG